MLAYLDHAATSRTRQVAAAAYAEELTHVGNPSSLHTAGRSARNRLEEAREEIAALIGARPIEVIFTSGGSEADQMAIGGTPSGGQVVISAIEHDAIRKSARQWWPDQLTEIPVDRGGRLDVAALNTAVSSRPTDLVSVMWANNETGVIQPIDEVVAAARSAGALVHSDAVQAVGRIPINFADSDLDMMSFTGHKIGGPVGTGVLVARTTIKMRDIRPGGGQERGVRSGTLDVAGARALAAALREATADLEAQRRRLQTFTDQLRAVLADLEGVTLSGAGHDILPGFVHATIANTDAQALLLLADMQRLAAASSSACHAGVARLSHVCEAMGIAESSAPLRLSAGWDTTAVEIEHACSVLPAIIAQARQAGAMGAK